MLLCVLLLLAGACAAYSELFKACREMGAQIHPHVAYPHPFNETGVGMIALEDIPPNQILFVFPLNACVSKLNLADDPMFQVVNMFSEFVNLVVTLLYEDLKGTDSPYYKYISLLDKDLVLLPKFWSSIELNELQDEKLEAIIYGQHMRVWQDFNALQRVLRSFHLKEMLHHVDFAKFQWAVGIAQSRSFMGPNNTYTLVPVADLMNHNPTEYISWELDIVNNEYVFATFPNRGYAKGTQIFNNYGGGEMNYHTLSEYGYVPFPNTRNSELLYLDQITQFGFQSLMQEKQRALTGMNQNEGACTFYYAINVHSVLHCFRVATSSKIFELEVGFTGFAWRRDFRALKQCARTLQHVVAQKKTSVTEDYALLFFPQSQRTLPLAVKYRIDAKIVFIRNLQFCNAALDRIVHCMAKRSTGFATHWLFMKRIRTITM